MSFWSSNTKRPVGQRSVSFASQKGLSYTENNKIVVEIDDTVSFFSGADSYLKFNVKVTGTRDFVVQCDPYIGGQVFVRDLRIYTRDNVLLEEMPFYNTWANIKYMYDTDDVQDKKRGLTEGTVLHNPKQRCWKPVVKSRETNTMYNPWVQPKSESDASLDQAEIVNICMPLHCGIFSNKTVFPNKLVGGIKLEIILSEAKHCFKGIRSAIDETFCPQLDSVTADSVDDQGGWPQGKAATEIFLSWQNNMVSAERCPFSVGEHIRIKDATNDTGDLGAISAIEWGKNTGTNYYVKLTIAAAKTNTHSFAAGALVTSFSLAGYTGAGVAKIGYEISDVELVVEEIMVDPAYESAMMKTMQEKGKIVYQCLCHQNYRHSVLNSDSSATVMLNLLNSKAKSILVVPTTNLNATDTANLKQFGGTRNAISGQATLLQDYQLMYHGRLNPDRPVITSRTSGSTGTYDMEYVIELEKALTFAGVMPRSFENIKTNFLIGRVLALSGQVYDTQNGDFQLNLNFDPSADTTKMLNCWVAHIREFEVSSEGVVVVY
eukprot:SAG22_NODE_509_length_9598_cov_12.010001_10_plen_547_part_00